MLPIQIIVSLLVLTCGPALLWRRRDNVLAYLSLGVFVSVYLIPLAPTLLNYRFDQRTVRLYADILSVGALAFLAGLALGGQIGVRSPNKLPVVFGRPIAGTVLTFVTQRARLIAIGGLVGLLGAFVLMGYVPFLAADRVSAKYGVGAYRGAFERGALVYRFGLAACGAILPVMLAVLHRGRKAADLALCVLLATGLVLSLSRESAFFGPLVFVIALGVQRRHSPVLIATFVAAAFSIGTLVSLIFVNQANDRPEAIASRIAASTPDLRDHIGFLRGYEKAKEPTYGRTLLAGLTLQKSEWDPTTYALRTLTGLSDLSDLASGGIRMPPPLWGYASFGWGGVVMFSAVAGLFTGWGMVKLRRLLTPVLGEPHPAVNLVVAVAFYEGTYGVLSEFYFLSSSVAVRLAVALGVGVAVRFAFVRKAGGDGPGRSGGPERPERPRPLPAGSGANGGVARPRPAVGARWRDGT